MRACGFTVLLTLCVLTATSHAQEQGQTSGLQLKSCLGPTAGCERDGKYAAGSGRADGSGAPERVDSAGRDGAFHLVMGAYVAAAGADMAVSMYQIGQGNAREVGFGAWWQDSPVAFAVSKGAVTALFAYGMQELHRSKPKTAMILGIVATSAEMALVARSARMSATPVP